MGPDSILENLEEPEDDLRVGIWIPRSFRYHKNVVDQVRNFIVLSNCDSEIFVDNSDNLIPEQTYNLLCIYNNVCLLTSNFPYFTHVDLSFSAKPPDSDFVENRTIDTSPIRCFSPSSSPKPELFYDEVESAGQMIIACVFIVISRDDMKSKDSEHLKTHISDLIESFKLPNQRTKFMLVLNGIKDLALANPALNTVGMNGTHTDNSLFLQIATINELISHLLVYYDVDTIETEDDSDLANVIAISSKSIRMSYHKRTRSKFRSKPSQSVADIAETTKKTWISQLLQLPNIGKREAVAISERFGRPAEIIESRSKSEEQLSFGPPETGERCTSKIKIGKSTTKRLNTLYSLTLVPEDIV